jgi:hypothetical protein
MNHDRQPVSTSRQPCQPHMNPTPQSTLPADTHRILRFALHRRRRGKIAALPEPAQEQINRMLDDGVAYEAIIARLGDAGKGLSKHCLSRWHKRSFQDWRESRFEARVFEDGHLPRNKVAADVRTVLTQLDPETIEATLKQEPAKLAPLIKAIVRIVVGCSESQLELS